MSRVRQFSWGLGSSWLATLATIIYSLLSVPIALKYLSVDEFGLFVLLLQVAGYFTLIEVGMSAATSRILVDHKDAMDEGSYGSVILTGSLVFAAQAFFILTLGVATASWIVALIGVPPEFSEIATTLLRWLAASSALSLAFRMYGSVLYANKRLDLIHAFAGGNMLFSLALLTTILASGGGLSHLVWLFLAQATIGVILPILACHKLRLLPANGHYGRPSINRFRELFGFGKDIFLVNVGNQVLEASQLIIITRTMGLTAAATWSINTKLFALIYQLTTKFGGTAIVFFAEMMVRGEADKLATRFRQIYQITAGIGVVSLAIMVSVNGLFVAVWAGETLIWPFSLSCLLAACVLLNALTRCSGDLIIHTKAIAGFRYIYFVEAAVFFALALWLTSHFGFYGILGASLLCLLLFRATYTTWRMAHYFKLPAKDFWWTWLKGPLLAALILLPFALSATLIGGIASNQWGQLFIASIWIGLPATVVLFLVALPRDVSAEIALRLPQISFFGKR